MGVRSRRPTQRSAAAGRPRCAPGREGRQHRNGPARSPHGRGRRGLPAPPRAGEPGRAHPAAGGLCGTDRRARRRPEPGSQNASDRTRDGPRHRRADRGAQPVSSSNRLVQLMSALDTAPRARRTTVLAAVPAGRHAAKHLPCSCPASVIRDSSRCAADDEDPEHSRRNDHGRAVALDRHHVGSVVACGTARRALAGGVSPCTTSPPGGEPWGVGRVWSGGVAHAAGLVRAWGGGRPRVIAQRPVLLPAGQVTLRGGASIGLHQASLPCRSRRVTCPAWPPHCWDRRLELNDALPHIEEGRRWARQVITGRPQLVLRRCSGRWTARPARPAPAGRWSGSRAGTARPAA